MTSIETAGDEQILVARHGHEAVALVVTDPYFGRIATVRIDHAQAEELADALDRARAAGGAEPV
jgi:hypothetical protein